MFSTLLIVAGLLFDKSPNPADGMPIVQSIRHLTENQTGQVENYGAIMLFNRDLKKTSKTSSLLAIRFPWLRFFNTEFETALIK